MSSRQALLIALATVDAALQGLHLPGSKAAPRCRLRLQQQAPIESLGIQLQRNMGQITFSEVTAATVAAEDVLSGRSASSTVSSGQVTVDLYYGQLTGLNVAGTRVLCKAFRAADQPASPFAPAATDLEARMRERLEASLGGGTSAASSLEAALDSDGRSGSSLAEAYALNEYAAHERVQLHVDGDVERRGGVTRLIGRLQTVDEESGAAVTLHAFPWRGEQVRMALPTRLPPTLASWAYLRERRETEADRVWRGVPLRAAQQRGRFVRAALRGALEGLRTLHSCGLVHQNLSPAAVALSTDDCRKGEGVTSTLQGLEAARDARSLYCAFHVNAAGDALTRAGQAYEAGDALDPLELGLAERALRSTLRPADPDERARYGVADDMREFGVLVLASFLIPNAPAGATDTLRLRSLLDGAFASADGDGMRTNGVDVAALRAYLEADDGLCDAGCGVGGARLLDAGGDDGSGWDLLAKLLACDWQDRPTAEEALRHPFWEAPMFL